MNDHDAELLAAIRDSLARTTAAGPEVRMTVPPAEIITRGRRRRRPLRASTGAALGLALIAGAVLGARLLAAGRTPPGGPARPPASSAPAATGLAAWTVTRDKDGIVTIMVRQALDPENMRRALAQAGVPAIVVVRHLCAPRGDMPQVPGFFVYSGRVNNAVFIRLRPSVMPPGTELLVAWQAVIPMGPRPTTAPWMTTMDLIWDYQAADVQPVNGKCPNLSPGTSGTPSG